MKEKIVLAVLIFLLVVGVTFFVRINQNASVDIVPNATAPLPQETVPANANNTAPSSNTISATILAVHNTQSDCWVAYKGKVYDITSFLPRHPGSAGAIAPYCGTSDGFEQAFTKKHGTSKVGMLMKVGVFIGDFDVVGRLSA